MQNKFLLLVALTPVEYLNPLRSRLQEVSLNSLRKVKYDNFQVLILGEKDQEEGKLKYIKSPNGRKGLRLAFALDYIKKHQIDYDYIARFDDDDVLNKLAQNQPSPSARRARAAVPLTAPLRSASE